MDKDDNDEAVNNDMMKYFLESKNISDPTNISPTRDTSSEQLLIVTKHVKFQTTYFQVLGNKQGERNRRGTRDLPNQTRTDKRIKFERTPCINALKSMPRPEQNF